MCVYNVKSKGRVSERLPCKERMSKTELMLLKIKCFYVFDLLKDEHRKFQPVTSFLVICQS